MVTMTITNTTQINKLTMLVKNFINPNSNTPISSISTTLATSGGVVLASYSSTVLSNLVADSLISASITPLSLQIGAQGVQV